MATPPNSLRGLEEPSWCSGIWMVNVLCFLGQCSVFFLFVFGPQLMVFGAYSWILLRHHSWWALGTRWSAVNWTRVGHLQGKYLAHCTIALAPQSLNKGDGQKVRKKGYSSSNKRLHYSNLSQKSDFTINRMNKQFLGRRK